MHEKKDSQFTVHLPSSKRSKLQRISERHGLSESEYVLNLLDKDFNRLQTEYDFMKTLFDSER